MPFIVPPDYVPPTVRKIKSTMQSLENMRSLVEMPRESMGTGYKYLKTLTDSIKDYDRELESLLRIR